jgi:glutamate-ammonia-ligase adenylyltransferase
VELLTRQLSDLADVLIEAGLASVTETLSGKLGVSPSTPYVVLGLGKLGGRELNYSSDVDLICVYGEDGEEQDPDGKPVSRLEFFHQLTERLVQSLSVATGEGHLYRVDMRLRPEGGAGPLARSLASTLTYYESRGELWERQMLIKARVVAGDPGFGADLLARLEPFVYPRTLFQHPSHYVARIKAKIESVVGDELNVKLMPGGIRDIEFSVQVLQLLHGGRDRSLRAANTLEALQRLADAADRPRRADGLAEACRFFRTVDSTADAPQRTAFRLTIATKYCPWPEGWGLPPVRCSRKKPSAIGPTSRKCSTTICRTRCCNCGRRNADR